ncbi:hypothetical protein T492DRAFT_142581 [Pavlovales sp. CCMP2436]|nr:hypothetical protein T492DRAFT_142581 [Pavlovales sp. CCMP2436]
MLSMAESGGRSRRTGLAILAVGGVLLVLSSIGDQYGPALLLRASSQPELGRRNYSPDRASTRFGSLSWAQPPESAGCGTWPTSRDSVRAHLEAVGVRDAGEGGWQCVGSAKEFEMPDRKEGATMEACEAWW